VVLQSTVTHFIVEFIAMAHQKAPPIRGLVFHTPKDANATDLRADQASHVFIVVAGYVDDLGTVLGEGEHMLEDRGLLPGPHDAAAHRPQVENITDEYEPVAVEALQEIEQVGGTAVPGTQVDVGNEGGSAVEGRHGLTPAFNMRPACSSSVTYPWHRVESFLTIFSKKGVPRH